MAIGVGVADKPISWPIVVASVLGLSVSGSLWWAYFDVVAIRAEHHLAHLHGRDRNAVAQAAYSYLHLPMLAGIVLVALGMKKVLEYVSDPAHHTLSDPLGMVTVVALLGGAALFLLAHVLFGLRTGCGVDVARPLVGVLLAVAIPLGLDLPALATLGLLAGVLIVLNVWETVRDRELRREVRAHAEA